jgi:hypothetical protein
MPSHIFGTVQIRFPGVDCAVVRTQSAQQHNQHLESNCLYQHRRIFGTVLCYNSIHDIYPKMDSPEWILKIKGFIDYYSPI